MTSSIATRGPDAHVHLATVPLERDGFLRTLIRHLSGTLQDIVGLEEAKGFITIVGQRMGEEINQVYREALQVENLTPAQVGEVCVDLKRRIQGQFTIVEQTDEKIVFDNTACPFADKVLGRPALCMMTSNVFGTIAAENVGYGKVVLERTIAAGDPGCRVVLYLKRTPESAEADGREYVRSE
jgi:hypothetical protein